MTDSVALPSETAAELRRQPLGVVLMGFYGAGTIVDAVVQAALATFLFFYFTIVCGLSNELAGLSLFLALVVDALIDPLVGSISDNSRSRLGRRHPFMFAGIVPLAVALGLLFSVPKGFSGLSLFTYVTFISVVLRVSHSIYFLPYVGLGAELSDDYAERTNIVASRFLFSVIGTGACLALGFGVFLAGAGKFHRDAYPAFGWACGAVTLVAGLFSAIATLRALPRLHQVAPATGSLVGRFLRDMGEIFRNRSFVVLFLSLLMLFIGAGTAATLYLHTATFFWKLPTWVIAAISYSAPIGLFFGVPISVLLSNRFEKRRVVTACLLFLVVYHSTVPTLRVLGLLPANGPVLYWLLIGCSLVVGAVVGCAGIGFQSMMADAADEHEAMFGTRREGLYYAGLNFSAKAASGLGALVAGLLLGLIQFPTHLAAQGGAGAHIAAATVRNLGLLYGPAVALIYGAATLVFINYRLDRTSYARIQETLGERRRAAAEVPVAAP